MKKNISFLLVLLVFISSIAFADVVDLLSGHGGPTVVAYELAWCIICGLVFIIVWDIYKIIGKDTKKMKKNMLIVLAIGRNSCSISLGICYGD